MFMNQRHGWDLDPIAKMPHASKAPMVTCVPSPVEQKGARAGANAGTPDIATISWLRDPKNHVPISPMCHNSGIR